MSTEISVGEAIVGLLEAYGVDTVFGIPGVHNVEMYRALPGSKIRHILPRHEQGAGFMADGYARATGRPGVCFTITGPGLTNILTPMGQAWSDSVPMLVISTALDVADQAFGRGRLHEMRDQRGAAHCVVEPAVAAGSGRRPRPAYLEVPIDVLKSPAGAGWSARTGGQGAASGSRRHCQGRGLLQEGGTAGDHRRRRRQAIERSVGRSPSDIGAVVFTTIAAKGVLPDRHPLHAGALLPNEEAIAIIEQADVVLAVGTEISETDLWDQRLTIAGALIRVDLDAAMLARPYPASLPILADAGPTLEAIAAALPGQPDGARGRPAAASVMALRNELATQDDDLRAMLRQVLDAIREGAARRHDRCLRHDPDRLCRQRDLSHEPARPVPASGRLRNAGLCPAGRHRRQGGCARGAGRGTDRRLRLPVHHGRAWHRRRAWPAPGHLAVEQRFARPDPRRHGEEGHPAQRGERQEPRLSAAVWRLWLPRREAGKASLTSPRPSAGRWPPIARP
jgi:thiamine pyrophosphate-dependent acetolactate synthase large subunit-like protein